MDVNMIQLQLNATLAQKEAILAQRLVQDAQIQNQINAFQQQLAKAQEAAQNA